MLWRAQAQPSTADRDHVGYEQAIARRQELRGITADSLSGTAAPARPTVTAADAALFQQQLATMASGDDSSSADGETGTGEFDMTSLMTGSPGASTDPYAALQGGGLAAQANIMAQLQGGANAATGATSTVPTIPADQLQQLLAQLQGQQTGGSGTVNVGTTLTHVTGKTKDLDPELLSRLDAVGAAIGKQINIISGNRTRAEQAELYQKYLNGTGNLAAPPGQSNHEHGDAADVYVDGVALANVPGAREAAARVGLHFPVGGEAWHVERTDH